MEYVQSSTWREVLDKYGSWDIDLIPALGPDDCIGREIIRTDPYISFPLVIVTGPDIDFICSTTKLEGKRVGVGEGYTSYHFMKNNHPQIELVTTDNVLEGLRLLDKGSIDAFVGHLAVVRDGVEKSRLNLHIAGKPEYVFEHCMGLPQEHARTVAIFNKVFEGMTAEDHSRIYNRWIDMERKRIKGLLEDLEILRVKLEERNDELKRLAITDKLTDLYNRFKLDEALYTAKKTEGTGWSYIKFGIWICMIHVIEADHHLFEMFY